MPCEVIDMSKIFSKLLGLSPPAPPQVMSADAVPPPPTTDEARLAAESRDEMLRKRGRRSTILTGPEGAAAGQTRTTTLIGN
jgi:hypothetical protein